MTLFANALGYTRCVVLCTFLNKRGGAWLLITFELFFQTAQQVSESPA